MADTTFETQKYIDRAEKAHADRQISEPALQNLKNWLTEPKYSQFVPDICQHIDSQQWQKLDDVFWTIIPFGTGGRRGRMYPFGSNAINSRTIGESAQGLADYVRSIKPDGPWSFAIAYDTRHRSREFAELCSGIMVANGFEVFFVDQYRSTPELSYLVRLKQCDCGIMVTASHNPPSDNAVKVYWSNGAQLIPPHDKAVIEKVNQVNEIEVADFQQSIEQGKIHIVTEEADAALLAQHINHSFDGPRDLKIVYSPLHGVGEANVKALLSAVGFESLEIYQPHREPSGDFPNVPGHVSNPENVKIFDAIIAHAQTNGSDLIMATDPDCDRLGTAAPVTTDPSGPWATFNGNQIGVLLADFIMEKRKAAGNLSPDHYVVTTLVTTMMIKRACDAYGIKCHYENLVGFKWICSVMDIEGPNEFIFGTEESHGYLVGQYCRDKDGAVACMLMSQLAAQVKAEGISMHDHLDRLYLKYGLHAERLVNIQMEGSDGMKRMQRLMEKFRSSPPKSIGGLEVKCVRDFQSLKRTAADGTEDSFEGPVGNLLIFDSVSDGNYVAARPSGTEPKVKFYMFAYLAKDKIKDLAADKQALQDRLDAYVADMQAFADTV